MNAASNGRDDTTLKPGSRLDIESHSPAEPLTNPTKAVALQMQGEEKTPVITAMGRGAIAEKILALAFEHGVKVRQDADLVELLSALEVEMPIPVEAYLVVAEILAYVYRAGATAEQRETKAAQAAQQDAGKDAGNTV